jgi:hypothetical protein
MNKLKQLLEPELHVIGEIIGGSGFGYDNAFATMEVKKGKEWVCVGGEVGSCPYVLGRQGSVPCGSCMLCY